jgi:hypothetical protein
MPYGNHAGSVKPGEGKRVAHDHAVSVKRGVKRFHGIIVLNIMTPLPQFTRANDG